MRRIFKDIDKAKQVIRALKKAGVRITIEALGDWMCGDEPAFGPMDVALINRSFTYPVPNPSGSAFRITPAYGCSVAITIEGWNSN